MRNEILVRSFVCVRIAIIVRSVCIGRNHDKMRNEILVRMFVCVGIAVIEREYMKCGMKSWCGGLSGSRLLSLCSV
jgi:hypothetical protein